MMFLDFHMKYVFSDDYFLIVQMTSGIDKLTYGYLLAPSGKFSEPFSAHGKSFRQMYQKK